LYLTFLLINIRFGTGHRVVEQFVSIETGARESTFNVLAHLRTSAFRHQVTFTLVNVGAALSIVVELEPNRTVTFVAAGGVVAFTLAVINMQAALVNIDAAALVGAESIARVALAHIGPDEILTAMVATVFLHLTLISIGAGLLIRQQFKSDGTRTAKRVLRLEADVRASSVVHFALVVNNTGVSINAKLVAAIAAAPVAANEIHATLVTDVVTQTLVNIFTADAVNVKIVAVAAHAVIGTLCVGAVVRTAAVVQVAFVLV
jgi:hypothetical protein